MKLLIAKQELEQSTRNSKATSKSLSQAIKDHHNQVLVLSKLDSTTSKSGAQRGERKMQNRSKMINKLALVLLSIVVLELVLIGDQVQPVKAIKKKIYLKKLKKLLPLLALVKPKKKIILVPVSRFVTRCLYFCFVSTFEIINIILPIT